MIERWLALLYPELVEKIRNEKTGLTRRQREWVRRCYSDEDGVPRCHFPVWTGDKWDLCWSAVKPEANHIIPQGYAKHVLFWRPEQIDNPYNLIINCAYHHTGSGYHGTLDWRDEVVPVFHPDNIWAKRHYKGKEKPTSYDILFDARKRQVELGATYWNFDWTEHLLDIARLRVEWYFRDNSDDPWPERRGR